jgi:hypothetical protein
MPLGNLLVSDEYVFLCMSKNSLLDFVLGRTFDDRGDMSKAYKYGWKRTIDSGECYLRCFDRLKKMGIIPLE